MRELEAVRVVVEAANETMLGGGSTAVLGGTYISSVCPGAHRPCPIVYRLCAKWIDPWPVMDRLSLPRSPG